jgi:hypothetical protein
MSSGYAETSGAAEAVQTSDMNKLQKVIIRNIIFRKIGQWTGFYIDQHGRVLRFVQGPPGNYRFVQQFEEDLLDECKPMLSGRNKRASANEG